MMGLEVYTCHKKHYSLNMLSPELLKEFLAVVKTYKQQRKFSFNIVDDPVEFFKERGFAEAWKNKEKSN
jgi:predicted nucleic acid-binding protein